ncbi:MAG TPA: two-component regulator propeller domain-containing protein, partial [Planctomycetia bacterium]|nr:two-component regulator propeller domain-containing protein [Planctomycetia bacterium]
DGALRQRVWTPAVGGAQGGRTLLLESLHAPAKMSGDLMTVFQAANGDYWFSSYTGGAFRYDGKTVVRFNSSDGLPADRVEGVQQDKKGDLFFSTPEGVSRFDGKSFTTLVPVKSAAPDKGWRLGPDDLWFKGKTGPLRYDGKSLYDLEFGAYPRRDVADAFFKGLPKVPWSPFEIYSMYRDRRGHMWFGTGNFGACRFDGKSLTWIYERHHINMPQGPMFGVRSMFEDKRGRYWFCNTRHRYDIQQADAASAADGLARYRTEPGIERYRFPDGEDETYFMSVVDDAQGDLWMATFGLGVFRYDGKTVTHHPVKDDRGAPVTLFSITKDNRGDLWLGTQRSGAFKFNGKSFERFNP